MTMNSPDALTQLFLLATSTPEGKAESVQTAELMREVGLKCIGFNGVSSLGASLARGFIYRSEPSRSPARSTALEHSAPAYLAK